MNQSVRFVLAVVLMIAVVVITNIIFPGAPRQTAVPADTAAAVQPQTAAPNQAAPAPGEPATPTAPAPAEPATPTAAAPADTILVESPLYRYGFSTRGAALVSAELLSFQSYTRAGPVQLAGGSPGGLLSHNIRINGQLIDLTALSFTPSQRQVILPEAGAAQILRFTHNSAAYGTITIDYQFHPENYLIDVRVNASTPGEVERLFLNLGPTLAINEERPAEDQRALAYVVNSREDGIQSQPLRKIDAQRIEEGPLDWVALKNKYFMAAAIVDTAGTAPAFGGLIAEDAEAEHAAQLSATLSPAAPGTFTYRLYIGPQEYDRLVAIGNKLQDVNPMGWRLFRPILRPLAEVITWALLTMRDALDVSYGWVLILFGILIRLAMWPLNAKAMRSQMKSMELQPKLKDIQTRYKNEPEKLQKEMLRLYKEEGFNPMGGCLPMLIPMPVLITLFFVFQSTIEFRGVSFLWLPDLSRPDPLYILPILLGATILVQQLISMKTMPPNPQMKFMMYFMPVMMVVIFWNLASGLNLYYAAQNLPGFIQQLQLTKERARYQRERGLLPATAPAAVGGAAPKTPAKGPRKKR